VDYILDLNNLTERSKEAINRGFGYFSDNQANFKPAAENADGVPYYWSADLWDGNISPTASTADTIALMARACIACGRYTKAEVLGNYLIDTMIHGCRLPNRLVDIGGGTEMESVKLGNLDSAVFSFVDGVGTIPAGGTDYGQDVSHIRGCFTTATTFDAQEYWSGYSGTMKTIDSYTVDAGGTTITLDDTSFSGDLQVFYAYYNNVFLLKDELYRALPRNNPAVDITGDYHVNIRSDDAHQAAVALKDLWVITTNQAFKDAYDGIIDALINDAPFIRPYQVLFDASELASYQGDMGIFQVWPNGRNPQFTVADDLYYYCTFGEDVAGSDPHQEVGWKLTKTQEWREEDSTISLTVRGWNTGEVYYLSWLTWDGSYPYEFVYPWVDNFTGERTLEISRSDFVYIYRMVADATRKPSLQGTREPVSTAIDRIDNEVKYEDYGLSPTQTHKTIRYVEYSQPLNTLIDKDGHSHYRCFSQKDSFHIGWAQYIMSDKYRVLVNPLIDEDSTLNIVLNYTMFQDYLDPANPEIDWTYHYYSPPGGRLWAGLAIALIIDGWYCHFFPHSLSYHNNYRSIRAIREDDGPFGYHPWDEDPQKYGIRYYIPLLWGNMTEAVDYADDGDWACRVTKLDYYHFQVEMKLKYFQRPYYSYDTGYTLLGIDNFSNVDWVELQCRNINENRLAVQDRFKSGWGEFWKYMFADPRSDIGWVRLSPSSIWFDEKPTMVGQNWLKEFRCTAKQTTDGSFEVGKIVLNEPIDRPYAGSGVPVYSLDYTQDGLIDWLAGSYVSDVNPLLYAGHQENYTLSLSFLKASQDAYAAVNTTEGPFFPYHNRDDANNSQFGSFEVWSYGGPESLATSFEHQAKAIIATAEAYFDEYVTNDTQNEAAETILNRWVSFLQDWFETSANLPVSIYNATITAGPQSVSTIAMVGRALMLKYMVDEDNAAFTWSKYLLDQLLGLQQVDGSFSVAGQETYGRDQALALLFLGDFYKNFASISDVRLAVMAA
jgi:hypothetical protein